MRSVAIFGTGLIGASFGLALRAAGFRGEIVGVSSPGALADATDRGAIDRGVSFEEGAAADLVYLAQPVGRIIDSLHRLDPHVRPETLVTDAGSTKEAIVDTAMQFLRRCRFLGGHPIAGKETRGAGFAEARLFEGRRYVLTPCEPEEMQTAAVGEFTGWLSRIGARLLTMTPEEHDRAVAAASHLPQLASTALASVLPEPAFVVAGPGLEGMTRLALSSYEVWRDILATNAENIDRELVAYIQKLEDIRENLRGREVQREFEAGAFAASRVRAGVVQ